MTFHRKHPQFVWATIACLLWAYLIAPVAVVASATSDEVKTMMIPGGNNDQIVLPPEDAAPSNPAPTKPPSLPPSASVPSKDDAPLNSDPVPAIDPGSSSAFSAPTAQWSISGNNNLVTQLKQLVNIPGQSSESNLLSALTQPGALAINGQLQPGLSLDASVNRSVKQPADAHWSLRYDGQRSKMQLGDIQASMGGNELVTLNRAVQGLQVDTTLSKGTISGLVSEIKAQPQTDTLSGQNTIGPYYVSMKPLTPGSETVVVNGMPLERDADYTIDYSQGAITFLRGRMISTNDQISVSYEPQVNGASGGRLVALRGTYPLSKQLTVGVSHISLTADAKAKTSAHDEVDRFQSTGQPGPFYLTYRPVIAGSESITVNGIRQNRDVAYTIDYLSSQFTFKTGHYPPYGASVVVNYRVAPSSTDSGNKSVTGFDVNWQNGKGLGFNLQTATSSGGNTETMQAASTSYQDEPLTVRLGTPLRQQIFRVKHFPVLEGSESVRSNAKILVRNQEYTLNYQTGELRLLVDNIQGQLYPTLTISYTAKAAAAKKAGSSAMTATATYNSDKVNAMARYRSMDTGFTSMDMVGTAAVKRAVEWATSYSPTSTMTLSTSGSNSRVPGNSWVGGNLVESDTNESNQTYAVDLHPKNLPSLTLQHSSYASKPVANKGLGLSSTTNSVSSSWSKNGLSANLNLSSSKTTNKQPVILASDESSSAADTTASTTYEDTSQNATLGLGYQAGEKVNIGVQLTGGKMAMKSDGVSSTTGNKGVMANVTYQPKKNLSLTGSLQNNKTEPVRSSDGNTSPAQQNRAMSLQGNWQPSKRVNVGVNYTANENKIKDGVTGSNATKLLSASVGWQAGKSTTLTGYAAHQSLDDPNVSGTTKSKLVGVGAQFSPMKNTTVNLNAQRMWGKGPAGVNQLWQTEAQARKAPVEKLTDIGAPSFSGNQLTAMSGSLSYRLGEKHDLTFGGEILKGLNQTGEARRTAFGIGWRYHPDENFSFSIDARRVKYADSIDSSQSSHSTEVDASLLWHF